MLAAFTLLADQLEAAYRSGRDAELERAAEPRSLTVCAMGGSAAAGDLVEAAFADVLPVPSSTTRGYRLPGWNGEGDLVACVSYSGDTEETIAAWEEATKRGCEVIAIATGGELIRRAESEGRAALRIPADAPVPRAGLGALVGGLLGALVAVGVLREADADVASAGAVCRSLAAEIGPDVETGRNEAKHLADWLGDRIPVIWGSEGISAAAAWRWKTAFNENAELPAFASFLPELDHHEILGWSRGQGAPFALLILREDGEHDRVQARLDATLAELEDAGMPWREVRASGATPFERGLALSLLGDLASAYHALMRGIDPAAMEPLERIKDRLKGDR